MTTASDRQWDPRGSTRVPYWIYDDPDLHEAELERIFEGPTWNFVALSAEVPDPGCHKATWIGRRPVVVTRDREGRLHVLENRCAHRGVQLCSAPFGQSTTLTCPYHQWSYGLDGRLLGVPLRHGIDGEGGLAEDFDPEQHGLVPLRVAERHGVVFAGFGEACEPLEDYLGPAMLGWFDRVFDGRRLVVLGDLHQRIPANWKLMFENIKDPYHASTLHVFLVTFGLFRADNPARTAMDEAGRHSVLVNSRRPVDETRRRLAGFDPDLVLEGDQLLDVVREFPGEETLVMQTIWPGLIVQQQSNTLAVRQLVPIGPDQFDLHWVFFGYEDDDEAMTRRRLMQANLMGPSGYVSLDDGEVLDLAQGGARSSPDGAALLLMGGASEDDADHAVTETAVRAFYRHYREVMGL